MSPFGEVSPLFLCLLLGQLGVGSGEWGLGARRKDAGLFSLAEEALELAREGRKLAPEGREMAEKASSRFREGNRRVARLIASGVGTEARTVSGRVYKGSELLSNTRKRPFSAFRGVRYARPILPGMRFKEPLPMDYREEIIQAKEEGSECIQMSSIDTSAIGSDDCLFLNIYSPNVSSEALLPAMIWIHGGAFQWGSGSMRNYDPSMMMDEDVVLITMNHRLGGIGFSSFEDDVHPGNLGLKDQKMALEWVKRNIKGFGGDPDNLTLFGYSAGGASVHYHMMFSNENGLFQRAISQSGTALSPWAFAEPGSVRDRTLRMAGTIGCSGNDSSLILDCLTMKHPQELVDAYLAFDILERTMTPFRPVLEGPDGFLTSDPWKKIDYPSIPWVVGTTSAEFLYFFTQMKNSSDSILMLFDAFYDSLAPEVLMLKSDSGPEKSRTAKAVRERYFQDSQIDRDHLTQLVQMMSDAWFTYSTFKSLDTYEGKVFNYYFDHIGQVNRAKFYGYNQLMGAVHGEEIGYLFKTPEVDIWGKGSIEDKGLSKLLLQFWTEFAKKGDPSLRDGFLWKPWTSERKLTLYLGSSKARMESNVLGERMRFWETLLSGVGVGTTETWRYDFISGETEDQSLAESVSEGKLSSAPSHVFRIEPKRKNGANKHS